MDEDSLESDFDISRPVLHILVVGFHHQRGAEVCYQVVEPKAYIKILFWQSIFDLNRI